MNRKAKALEFLDAGYNIQITGRHVNVTEPMKDYAMDKISKIERFVDRIIDVNVIMDIQKLDHRVEIIFKAGGIKILSQAVTTDMYVSIDQAVDKLETQIRRYKSRIQDYHAKSRAAVEMNVNVIAPKEIDEEEYGSDREEAVLEAFKPHAVVKKKTLPLKTLTVNEAVMKMDLSSNNFLIFKNEADQKLKVIYRRRDGNYGIVEPAC